MPNAWITLATTDGYAVGALVLAQSLKNVQTQHKMHVLYTKSVSSQLVQQLKNTFDGSTEVDIIDSKDHENLSLIDRPNLGLTFTKIHCWRLTQYLKCVFLDADTLVIQNSDELFDHPEIAAAPDIGWPDYFNSGVFVFIPSLDTYQKLLKFAFSCGSFDGGDQGLLNMFFNDWRKQDINHRLSFLYNVTSNTVYSYAVAIKRNFSKIKIVHFLGKDKPWDNKNNASNSIFLQKWYEVYVQIAANNKFSTLNENSSILTNTNKRYEAWEQGNPDYTGEDSFSNIQKVIKKSLE